MSSTASTGLMLTMFPGHASFFFCCFPPRYPCNFVKTRRNAPFLLLMLATSLISLLSHHPGEGFQNHGILRESASGLNDLLYCFYFTDFFWPCFIFFI